MDEQTKEEWPNQRKKINIFRFIDDLNPNNYSGDDENRYSNIYPEELQLGK